MPKTVQLRRSARLANMSDKESARRAVENMESRIYELRTSYNSFVGIKSHFEDSRSIQPVTPIEQATHLLLQVRHDYNKAIIMAYRLNKASNCEEMLVEIKFNGPRVEIDGIIRDCTHRPNNRRFWVCLTALYRANRVLENKLDYILALDQQAVRAYEYLGPGTSQYLMKPTPPLDNNWRSFMQQFQQVAMRVDTQTTPIQSPIRQ